MFRGKKEPKKDLNIRVMLRVKSIPENQHDTVMNTWEDLLKQFEERLGQLYNQRRIDIDLLKQISKAFDLERYGSKIKDVELSAIFSSGAGDMFDTDTVSSPPGSLPQMSVQSRSNPSSSNSGSEPDPFDFEALLSKESSSVPPSSNSGFEQFIDSSSKSPSSLPLSSPKKDVDFEQFFGSSEPSSQKHPSPPLASSSPSIPPPVSPSSQKSMPSINIGKLTPTTPNPLPPTSPPTNSSNIPLPSPIPSSKSPSRSPVDSSPSAIPAPRPAPGDEEDRATGIAILRKQMLTELKKIRSIIDNNE